MADKLLIIMLNSDPKNPTEMASPLFQAAVAAAMEYEVEVIFTGRASELAIKGVAGTISVQNGENEKTVAEIIQEAHDAGVKFKICATALDQWGDELIPEIEETVGGAYIVSEAMDEATVTFTY